MFEKEMETYEKEKPRLLGSDEGRYVVIKGEKIAGVWDTYGDALKAGYLQFGLEQFFVKQILRIEKVYSLSLPF